MRGLRGYEIAIGFLLATIFWVGVLAWQSSLPAPNQPAIGRSEQGSEKKSDEILQAERADDRIARYTLWLAILTGALVLVSSIQIFFLIRTDKIARLSAEAAKQSADALIGSERAWLLLVMDGWNFYEVVQKYMDKDNWPALAEERLRPTVQFHFKNFGKTPAFVKEVAAKISHSTMLAMELRYIRDREPKLDDIVGAGETLLMEAFSQKVPLQRTLGTPFDQAAARGIAAENTFFWFWGRVVYDDVWGNEHETRFCWCGNMTRFEPYRGKPYNENT